MKKLIVIALLLQACAEKDNPLECKGDLCLPSPPTNIHITCEKLHSEPLIEYPDGVIRRSSITSCGNCITYSFVDDGNIQIIDCK